MATCPVPDILKIAETGRAEDLWQELRDKADSSLYYFAKVVINYRDLVDHFHLPLCDTIQKRQNDILQGFLMPRGTFKSTIRTKSYVLWKYLHNHEERFLISGATDTIAKKALIDIKWHVLNNQLLRWLYPELNSVDPGQTKWTDAEILLPRKGTYDEPSVTCDGIGAKRTGFHYTEIIFDDPIAEVDAESDVAHETAWDYIQFSRGLLHEPEKSRRTFVGTRWGFGTFDVFGKIMEYMLPEPDWYIRSAVEDDAPTFPERLSLPTLIRIRGEMGDYKYNCQYLNRPSVPGSTDFESNWLQEYDVAEDNKTIIPCDGTSRIGTGMLLRMSMLDPSGGGKSANCENAICVAGMASDRRIFVLQSWGKNCTIGQAVEQWHVFNDRWQCYHNHYERVGAQKAVEDMCFERKHQPVCPYCKAGHVDDKGKYYVNPHRKLNPIGVPPEGGKNKEDRIRMYAQKPAEEKRIYLRRGLMVNLRRQITEFPHGALVDEFDALAYLCHLLRPPMSDADLESSKAEDAKHRLPASQRTNTDVCWGGYV